MKRISSLLLFVVLVISLLSCTQEIGQWDDCIKLSTKSVEFSSNADSVIVTTEGDWWWVTDVSVENEYFHISPDIDLESDSYSIQQDCFVVERRDKHTLYIQVDENPLNIKRVISVGLEAGDYFDRIYINQAAK